MFILKLNLLQWIRKSYFAVQLLLSIIYNLPTISIMHRELLEQIIIVGPQSLAICLITGSFIGIVFTIQVIKEFLYLDAANLVGAVLSLSFIRELSPVLVAVIIIGRIGSFFTSELAIMKVTEQIDALYLLRIDPTIYLVVPRLLACIFMLPFLNLFFLCTSLFSSIFISYIFYNIHPWIFLNSSFAVLSYQDCFKSTCKVIVFGLIVSIVSCSWGLTAYGGSKNIGQITTSSVVTSLLIVFIMDFILTYFLFNQDHSAIRFL